MTHEASVQCAAYSPDGNLILTGSGAEARLWDADKGGPARLVLPCGDDILSVAFSHDAKRVLTCCTDNVKVWNAENGSLLAELREGDLGFESAIFGPDSEHVLVRCYGQSYDSIAINVTIVTSWDVAGRKRLNAFGADLKIKATDISDDAARVATVYDDKVTVWDVRDGSKLAEIHRDLGDRPFESAAFSPGGKVDSNRPGERHQRTVVGYRYLKKDSEISSDLSAASVLFSPDGASLLSDGPLTIWDCSTGTVLLRLTQVTGGAESLAFSPDSSRLLVSSEIAVHILSVRSGQVLMTLEHEACINLNQKGSKLTFATLSPDGKRVLTTQNRSSIAKVWEVTKSEDHNN